MFVSSLSNVLVLIYIALAILLFTVFHEAQQSSILVGTSLLLHEIGSEFECGKIWGDGVNGDVLPTRLTGKSSLDWIGLCDSTVTPTHNRLTHNEFQRIQNLGKIITYAIDLGTNSEQQFVQYLFVFLSVRLLVCVCVCVCGGGGGGGGEGLPFLENICINKWIL